MDIDSPRTGHTAPFRLAQRRRTRRAALLSFLLLTFLGVPTAPSAALRLPVPTRVTPSATTAEPLAGQGAPLSAGISSPAPADGVWPLSPRPDVLSGFDPPTSRWGAGHRGADLAGAVGQVVRAALAGTVSFAGRIARRGVVVVDHGDTRTTYEPVAAAVVVGDEVDAGDPIGRLELLGSHCLPRACLHWGLLRGTTYLDPLTLVGAGPVRLLPWLDEAGG